jgi:hypothetical protein
VVIASSAAGRAQRVTTNFPAVIASSAAGRAQRVTTDLPRYDNE